MSLYLGDRETAIETFEYFLAELKGSQTQQRGPEGTNPGDMTPDDRGMGEVPNNDGPF